MIEKIEIQGGLVDEKTKKYAEKRLSRIDKYMGKRAKDEEVTLKLTVEQIAKPYGNKFEMVVKVDKAGELAYIAKEEVANMTTGVDILETKLKGQMRKTKTQIARERRGVSKKLRGIFGKRG